MEEINVTDMIEPIEEPMWHYDGGRSSGKSYFGELLRSKDKEIEKLKKETLSHHTKLIIAKGKQKVLEERINKALEYINSDEMLKLREEFEYCNDKDLFDDFAGHLDRILREGDSNE